MSDPVIPTKTSEDSEVGIIPQVTSAELLGEMHALEILHRGDVYRLQITRQGKLILTK